MSLSNKVVSDRKQLFYNECHIGVNRKIRDEVDVNIERKSRL